MWWTNTYSISSDIWGSTPTNFKRLTETQQYNSPFVSIWVPSLPPSFSTSFSFSCSLKHSTGFSHQGKQESVWQSYFVSTYISPSIFTFLIETRMSGGRCMDYFPLSLSSLCRSTNNHSSCQEFYLDLGTGLTGAQQHKVLTLDLGSGGHFIFWGSKRTENKMVICLLGSLSSHHNCSNKCLLPSWFLLPEIPVGSTVLLLPPTLFRSCSSTLVP